MSDNNKNQTNTNGNQSNNSDPMNNMNQLVSLQNNSMIMDRFAQILLGGSLTIGKLRHIVFSFIFVVFFKYFLDESKKYMDNINTFGFYNVQYAVQRMYTKYRTYVFESSGAMGDAWTYMEPEMNTKRNVLNDRFGIFVAGLSSTISIRRIVPKTVYFKYGQHSLICVAIFHDNKDIHFIIPSKQAFEEYFTINIPLMLETKIGNKTALYKGAGNPNGGVTFIQQDPFDVCELPQYEEITRAVEEHLDFNSRVQCELRPRLFSLTGPPGTGKSSYGMTAAQKGLFDVVLRINMMNFTTLSFEKIMAAIRTSANWKDKKVSMLIIFDEIDKWWIDFVKKEISAMRNKQIDNAAQEKNGQANGKTTAVSVNVTMPQEDIDRRVSEIRGEFLNSLQLFADGDRQPTNGTVVAIFNSNDWEILFAGAEKAHSAVKSRFTNIVFNYIGKDLIIMYVEYIYNKAKFEMSGADKAVLQTISSDVKISHRLMERTLRDNLRRLAEFVAKINDIEYIKLQSDAVDMSDALKLSSANTAATTK
jgi:hypothetical protein